MIDAMRRMFGALAFISVTIVLAKVGQYAVVDCLASVIGFGAASLIGASPVVIVAALLQRRRRARSRRDATPHAIR